MTQGSLNPYREAAGLIYRRLLWDLRPASWVSRHRLQKLKNSHIGERCVILCNGPSLLETDFSLLSNSFSFGLNKINLLFDKVEFRPSCVVAVNPFVLRQNKQFYRSTTIPLFLDSSAVGVVGLRPNISYLHSTNFPAFAEDVSMSIFQGYTVTFVAMELAFHMGFERVALIGCDHSFIARGNPNETQIMTSKDFSHFDRTYFSEGQQWQLPDLAGSEYFYELAKRKYERAGKKIVNATKGGALEIFPRMELSDFLRH